jgi:hypothetical protein
MSVESLQLSADAELLDIRWDRALNDAEAIKPMPD